MGKRSAEQKSQEHKEESKEAGIGSMPYKEALRNMPDTEMTMLSDLMKPHVDSFDFALAPGGGAAGASSSSVAMSGLDLAVQNMAPVLIEAVPDHGLPAVKIWIESAHIDKPSKTGSSKDTRLFPNECRELGETYSGQMKVSFVYEVMGENPKQESIVRKMGAVPVMVKSSLCHLHGMNRSQLIAHREEGTELGGYFIVGGLERLIRLLIMPRRNHVLALIRPSFVNRGRNYTAYATSIRCVRPDQSSKTITLHYLSNGSCNLRVSLRKQEFFLPAVYVLKALVETSDREIYEQIVAGNVDNAFLTDRAELMVRDGQRESMQNKKSALTFLGSNFRGVFRADSSSTDEEVGKMLLDELFIHCGDSSSEAVNNRNKFNVLIFMIQKLYALAQGTIKPDNADALSSHEILLPGHLYLMILKEKLQDWLQGIKATVMRDVRVDVGKVKLDSESYWRKVMDKQADVPKKLQYFLQTGNLISNTGLDLMQVAGFTIIGEKLNYYRYISHFRSVHRGQFFTTMKTTAVRKLLPESWGFMCPVHTPDGSPCGLLNHLAAKCHIQTHLPTHQSKGLLQLLVELGMTPSFPPVVLPHDYLPIHLDGVLIGRVAPLLARRLCSQLRLLKVKGHQHVPYNIEIFAVYSTDDACYPSINLSTAPGRMIRPVYYLPTANSPRYIEWIGPMEQLFMDIAVTEEDFRKGETTHMEISPTNMLSVVASFTPFSDFNQSPRNMYQCQMGKQTMGTPFHSFPYRVDNKVYRIQHVQTPLVRNKSYEEYGIDEYPLGVNAVVAVISYTGYDMEDAMIINKSAYERGFGHGSVYKYKKLDLDDYRVKGEPIHHFFNNCVVDKKQKQGKESKAKKEEKSNGKDSITLHEASLGPDGLPEQGQVIKSGDPLYTVYDQVGNKFKTTKHKEPEDCSVEQIRYVIPPNGGPVQKVGLNLRFNRNPLIGDKFSSRHGQKGVLSQLWPQENMPFSESGMTPDVIINPHAFPSRMTIGMLIESMAGKVGANFGKFEDGTPFRFNEHNTAAEHFGKQLVAAGYNYAGTEPLYSGIDGVLMQAEIFIGVVYYQRLRHMVSDKSQVRSTGPVNAIHRQPIKGRKVHGGIRFGEMERDSLLAHGVSFLLNDRLMNCSDYHTGYVCSQCGSILSPFHQMGTQSSSRVSVTCKNCNTGKGCALVAVPYVFVYLVNELAAMNIRLTLNVE